ncbi:hypothetical protein EDB85DRAFT_2144531 [Lactarius pseudohatsudake]|nr:hypothetical protein EDB85DRAFT_2144531 [Lactarius pseudohatsudake]
MEGSVHAYSTYSFNSASTPPTSSISPPGVVAVQQIADRRTSSDVLDIPSLPSSTPVPDGMHPIESHSSLLAPAAPCPSRPRLMLSSAPRGGSANVAWDGERDALDPPSTNRENIMAAPDLPPQSVTDSAIADPSWRFLGAEHTGNHPPHPSHGQYDIV